MKLAVFAALVGVCVAATLDGLGEGEHEHHDAAHHDFVDPRPSHARPVVAILFDDRTAPAHGSYATNFETEDGVRVSEIGQPGVAGQSNVEGSYSFTDPEGNLVEVRYVADENGFRAEGPSVPTPHPLPAHALQQIAFAEEQIRQRAQSGDTGPIF